MFQCTASGEVDISEDPSEPGLHQICVNNIKVYNLPVTCLTETSPPSDQVSNIIQGFMMEGSLRACLRMVEEKLEESGFKVKDRIEISKPPPDSSELN